MALPRMPTGLKPLVSGYSIGAPAGVAMTDVAGGLPRTAQMWDRGRQPFHVAMVNNVTTQSVWTVFFTKVLKGGAVPFVMQINSGMGLEDHACVMTPGSYSSQPAGSGMHWRVEFDVLAEASSFSLTDADAQALVDVWNNEGTDIFQVMDLLEQIATVDSLTWNE